MHSPETTSRGQLRHHPTKKREKEAPSHRTFDWMRDDDDDDDFGGIKEEADEKEGKEGTPSGHQERRRRVSSSTGNPKKR